MATSKASIRIHEIILHELPVESGAMSLLNLKGWKVTQMTETATDYKVKATFDGEPTACPKCGQASGFLGHGTRPQRVMDIPTHGKRASVTITRKRYRCRACGATFLQPVEGLHEGGSMTTRLVNHIRQASLTRTFADLAHEIGVDEKTIRNVFNAYVEHLDRIVKFPTPTVLGIDEVHLIGNARCVFTDPVAPSLIGMLEKRNKPDVIRFLQGLPDKERVKVVTIDMWKPYRDAVRQVLPEAAIVVDKFHVVRMATDAVETVRRGLRDSMNTTVRRKMMRSRYLLLRRTHQLKPDDLDTLKQWTDQFPELYYAYTAKEQFYSIWELTDRADAEAAYGRWVDALDLRSERFFRPLVTAIGNWHKEVFAYFDHRFTNAATEALNGLIKIANRSGRGYSFRVLRAKMLYGRKVLKTKLGSPVTLELVQPPDTYNVHITLPPNDPDALAKVMKIIREHVNVKD